MGYGRALKAQLAMICASVILVGVAAFATPSGAIPTLGLQTYRSSVTIGDARYGANCSFTELKGAGAGLASITTTAIGATKSLIGILTIRQVAVYCAVVDPSTCAVNDIGLFTCVPVADVDYNATAPNFTRTTVSHAPFSRSYRICMPFVGYLSGSSYNQTTLNIGWYACAGLSPQSGG